MKKFFFVFFLIVSVFCLNLSVFAVDPDAAVSSSDASGESNVNVYVTNEIVGEDLGEYVGTSVYALNPVTPSDTSGLKAVLLEVIGPYDAIVVEHQYESYNGSFNYVREIQYDFPWLCSCGLFVVVLFCVLRGGLAYLCRK